MYVPMFGRILKTKWYHTKNFFDAHCIQRARKPSFSLNDSAQKTEGRGNSIPGFTSWFSSIFDSTASNRSLAAFFDENIECEQKEILTDKININFGANVYFQDNFSLP